MRIIQIPTAYLDKKEDFGLLKDAISVRFKALCPDELKRLFSCLSPDEVYTLYKAGLTEESYRFVVSKIGQPRVIRKREARYPSDSLFAFDYLGEFKEARDAELRKYVL